MDLFVYVILCLLVAVFLYRQGTIPESIQRNLQGALRRLGPGLVSSAVYNRVVVSRHEPRRLRLERRVIFVKTHSTGSSTITGVLHRYCDRYGAHCPIYPKGLFPGATIASDADLRLLLTSPGFMNIWPNHVHLLPKVLETFDEMMPLNMKFSIFRDPLSRVLSAFRHAGPKNLSATLQNFRADADVYGCGPAGTPSSHHVPLQYFDRLDLVMLTEEFDTSLMLLRRYLGWSMEDMLYIRMKDHNESTDGYLEKLRKKVARQLTLPESAQSPSVRRFYERCIKGVESQLYEMAKAKFSRQIDAVGKETLREEVQRFTSLRGLWLKCCDERPSACRAWREDNMEWMQRHRRHSLHEDNQNSMDLQSCVPRKVGAV